MSIFKRKKYNDDDIHILLKYINDIIRELNIQKEQIALLTDILLQADIITQYEDEQRINEYIVYMKGNC